MIYVNFNGRLGADAEIRTDRGGRQFVSMRIATDEFKGGTTNTVWLSVFDYSPKTQKMAASLKKGSLVSVHGVETVSVYTTAQGQTRVNRDITSDRVDFISSGTKQMAADNTQQVPMQGQATAPTCGTFTRMEPPQQAASIPTPSMDDVDDLPF